MKQKFDLSLWLKDKNRKVVTRDGREVRIICTDAKLNISKHKSKQIIALVPRENETEITLEFYSDGTFYRTEESYFDLFFADEEEELSEFEKEILNLLNCATPEGHSTPTIEKTKEYSQKLLDLARKEIEKDYCIMEPFEVSDLKKAQRKLGEAIGRANALKEIENSLHESIHTDLHLIDEAAYLKGKEDALKDLPKWKKITKPEQKYLAYGFLSWDGYYLSINGLKRKLPKEK